MTNGLVLQGRSIVITRPAHQATAITQRLQATGATVFGFPLLEITEPRDLARSRKQLSQLSQYDYLIFTSPNAVEWALSKLPAKLSTHTEPIHAKVAAVGKKTAMALASYGIEVSVVPDKHFNSEALLACPQLQSVSNRAIAIIRGEGGRGLLRDTLIQRGATVDYVDVYRRICPADDLLPLVKFQQQAGVDIIVLTSVESLQHLFRLNDGLLWLNGVDLLVGSERIASMINLTTHTGNVVIASDPSDDTIYGSLLSWANHKNT